MNIQKLFNALFKEASKVIVGQEAVLTQMLIALLASGHVLMEGVPGTAKTLTAKTLAQLVQVTFHRIQFTPDLMPSDVVGTNVFNMATSEFSLRKGPIFAGVVLADEINRAPAKTQSALLEAMEERQVTIDARQHDLPQPFMVVATQNPVEFEGTYPLPEAQLDRFFFKVLVSYPKMEEEEEMLARFHKGFNPHALSEVGLRQLISPEQLTAVQKHIQTLKVEKGILSYITLISNATRESQDLYLGGSPRASVALLQASKVHAAINGRQFVTPDDVKAMVPPVYRHRIILRPETTLEGTDADTVLERILSRINVPR